METEPRQAYNLVERYELNGTFYCYKKNCLIYFWQFCTIITTKFFQTRKCLSETQQRSRNIENIEKTTNHIHAHIDGLTIWSYTFKSMIFTNWQREKVGAQTWCNKSFCETFQVMQHHIIFIFSKHRSDYVIPKRCSRPVSQKKERSISDFLYQKLIFMGREWGIVSSWIFIRCFMSS